MIKKLIPLVALLISGVAVAQIGIGTERPASSAQLDITASDKGVLLPRVELQSINDRGPIVGDLVESLLVYHVGNSNLEAGFYYWKTTQWNALLSGATYTDRRNNTFTIGANPDKAGEESLIITDTKDHKVFLAIKEIANNSTFVTELTENSEFITKLGDNVDFINQITNKDEFITNIINELKGKYGNVAYDPINKVLYYIDEFGARQTIDWTSINTINVDFGIDNNTDDIVITDSHTGTVSMPVTELASNKTFVEYIAGNTDFITKLGDNVDFINKITENNEFVTNILNELKGKYGNVAYDPINKKFYYIDDQGAQQTIDWTSINTINVDFGIDNNDDIVITDSHAGEVSMPVTELASNQTFVEHIANNSDFIKKLGDNIEFTEIINGIAINYSYDEQIKPEKWLDSTKQIASRSYDIEFLSAKNVVEVAGDFASVILSARLINKATNSITEGVLKKTVVGGNTQIVLGTSDTFTVMHPAGDYYLILEYVKK